MNILRKIVKEVLSAPVYVVEGIRGAIDHAADPKERPQEVCPGCRHSFDTCECPYPDQVDAAAK